MFGRIRKSARASARAGGPGLPDVVPPRILDPAATRVARLPGRPTDLFREPSWVGLVQLADQRIRAHRRPRVPIGEVAEAVSGEVAEALEALAVPALVDAWRAWAALAHVPAPYGLDELVAGTAHPGSDDVEAALRVHADLAALVPQLVDARISENVR